MMPTAATGMAATPASAACMTTATTAAARMATTPGKRWCGMERSLWVGSLGRRSKSTHALLPTVTVGSGLVRTLTADERGVGFRLAETRGVFRW